MSSIYPVTNAPGRATFRLVDDMTDEELLRVFGMERGALGPSAFIGGSYAECMANRADPWMSSALLAVRRGQATATDKALIKFAALEINARHWMGAAGANEARTHRAYAAAYQAGLDYAATVYEATLETVVSDMTSAIGSVELRAEPPATTAS